MFFDSHGQARHIVNSRGKKRRPGTKDIAMTLRCSDASFVGLIEGCLRWDASERLTPEEAMQHSFIQKIQNPIAQASSSSSTSMSSTTSRHHHHHHRLSGQTQGTGGGGNFSRNTHGTRYPTYQSKRASARRRVNVNNDAYSFSNWESEHASTSYIDASKTGGVAGVGGPPTEALQWAQGEASLLPPIRA